MTSSAPPTQIPGTPKNWRVIFLACGATVEISQWFSGFGQVQLIAAIGGPVGFLNIHVNVIVSAPGREFAVRRPEALQAGRNTAIGTAGQLVNPVDPEPLESGIGNVDV